MAEPAPAPTLDLLQSRGDDQAEWHAAAAAITRDRFGRDIFVRGVVELSNHCRENCAYCGMRRDHRELKRYRARVDNLAELLVHHRPACITDVNLQAGEDPIAAREIALPLVRILRAETPLGISACLGTLDTTIYRELRSAGATIYIMKFEVSDPEDYRRLAAPGSLDERLSHIQHLADSGWHVSSGWIAGLPGRDEHAAVRDLQLATRLPLAGCSVSPFIPGEATPLRGAPPAALDLTLNCMAALRFMRPDWVIPAVSALNLADPILGYRRGFRAGANLATLNLTPADLREDYVIYRRDRFIMTEERILAAIDAEGLRVSRTALSDHYNRRRRTPPPDLSAASRGPTLRRGHPPRVRTLQPRPPSFP